MSNLPLNLSEALSRAANFAKSGEIGRAEEAYKEILAQHPGHELASRALQTLRANTRHLSPSDQQRLRRLERLVAEGKVSAAADAGEALMREFPNIAYVPNVTGIAEARRGRLGKAIKLLNKATALDPGFQPAWINLTTVLRLAGRDNAALVAAEQAVALDPELADAQVNLGKSLGELGRTEDALAAFGQAVRLKPDLEAAHDGICGLYEKENQISNLRSTVEVARKACTPDNPVINFRIGQLALREGDYKTARATLEAIPSNALPPEMRAALAEHLGKAYDRLGKPAKAFRHFIAANEFTKQRFSNRRTPKNTFRQILEKTEAALDEQAAPHWPKHTAGQVPAFLVGFPRSGTTLLDTILRGHPDIAVIEEMPLVENLRARLEGRVTMDDLDRLTEKEIEDQAQHYWSEARTYYDGSPSVVIDKMPLNLTEVPLIARIFPGAKFVLALRHPADCVLSGFMQTFRPNAAMDNFLTLEGSAALYDHVMRIWCKSVEKLGIEVQEVRYEDVISDLRGATEPVLNFLGCAWTDEVEDFRRTAEARGRIRTPSYSQVSQDLYQTAAGRWKNYGEQLAPVMGLLAPWIEHWGYGDEQGTG